MPTSQASPSLPDPAPFVALIEDDPVMGQSIVDWLGVEGYRVRWFRNGAEAVCSLPQLDPDMILCDIRLPDMTGEAIHGALAAAGIAAPAIFITGHGDVAQAVRLMRAGAADYITKPFDIEALLRRIEELLAPSWTATEGFVLGEAPAMRQVERMLRRIAAVDSNVLLTGPSGSGKEVAARFLHSEGRHGAPFVALNCAAIPNDLLESEIFGHERGAFTGAVQRHAGVAERAGAGTLFLDEVAELPLALQAKLLRLLQDRSFRRVGGDRDLPLRARVLAATNAQLATRLAEGRFREDLFFRLSVISVAMPPLCDRAADIVPLARRFLVEFSDRFGRASRGFSTLAEVALGAHDFPGNIRELRNRIERAVALAEGEWIGPTDLFPERAPPAAGPAPERVGSLAEARDAAERRAIAATLAATGGDVAQAAEQLGVSRSTLFDKVRRLNIRAAPPPAG
jgi:DNA-binding NtrC family response regulator